MRGVRIRVREDKGKASIRQDFHPPPSNLSPYLLLLLPQVTPSTGKLDPFFSYILKNFNFALFFPLHHQFFPLYWIMTTNKKICSISPIFKKEYSLSPDSPPATTYSLFFLTAIHPKIPGYSSSSPLIHYSTHSKLPSSHYTTEGALSKITGQESVNSAGLGCSNPTYSKDRMGLVRLLGNNY